MNQIVSHAPYSPTCNPCIPSQPKKFVSCSSRHHSISLLIGHEDLGNRTALWIITVHHAAHVLIGAVAVIIIIIPPISPPVASAVPAQQVARQEQLVVPREALAVLGVGDQARRLVRVAAAGQVDRLVRRRGDHGRAEG